MMAKNKTQKTVQLLSSIGLLLATLPTVLKEYIFIPDFFRGFFVGIGLAVMIGGLIWQKKQTNSGAAKATGTESF